MYFLAFLIDLFSIFYILIISIRIKLIHHFIIQFMIIKLNHNLFIFY